MTEDQNAKIAFESKDKNTRKQETNSKIKVRNLLLDEKKNSNNKVLE
jgi:hypothetical protein